MAYSTLKRGVLNSTSYKIFIRDDESPISAFNDIPLYADDSNLIYNVIVLSPRWSNAKMKISLTEPLNPIVPQVNNGQVSYVPNCFPHHGYIWNRAVFPQVTKIHPVTNTTEEIAAETELDTVDLLEIGYRVAKVGDIIRVKVLATIFFERERCNRVIGIDVNDPLAPRLHNLSSVMQHFPGLLEATTEWFEIHSSPQCPMEIIERPVNLVHNIIKEMHFYWNVFTNNPTMARNFCIVHVTGVSDNKIERADAALLVIEAPPLGEPLPISEEIHTWLFDHIQTHLSS